METQLRVEHAHGTNWIKMVEPAECSDLASASGNDTRWPVIVPSSLASGPQTFEPCKPVAEQSDTAGRDATSTPATAAALPPGWIVQCGEEGQLYDANTQTGLRQWELPDAPRVHDQDRTAQAQFDAQADPLSSPHVGSPNVGASKSIVLGRLSIELDLQTLQPPSRAAEADPEASCILSDTNAGALESAGSKPEPPPSRTDERSSADHGGCSIDSSVGGRSINSVSAADADPNPRRMASQPTDATYRILDEILETEDTYIGRLCMLDTIFYRPLFAPGKAESLGIHINVVRSIFGNIVEILVSTLAYSRRRARSALSMRFAPHCSAGLTAFALQGVNKLLNKKLKERVIEDRARGVSDIFVEMGPFLKCYSRYCEAYQAANQLFLRRSNHEYTRQASPSCLTALPVVAQCLPWAAQVLRLYTRAREAARGRAARVDLPLAAR
jgi:hypothetical protein